MKRKKKVTNATADPSLGRSATLAMLPALEHQGTQTGFNSLC